MEEFFDPSFLAELESLAGLPGTGRQRAIPASLPGKLAAFLAPRAERGETAPLDEGAFVALPPGPFAERLEALVEVCRESGRTGAVQAVEGFIIFFQALVPTLHEEAARAIKAVFFHLVPSLIHIAYTDFGDEEEQRRQGRRAFRHLETILIEISSVRLAPAESQLVFKSIDQLTNLIGAGDYALANEIFSARLLSIISRSKLSRALFRLMEVEVSIQRYLKARLGYSTPQVRVPEDVAALADYGPIRMLSEEGVDGVTRRFIQVQLPDLPILRDIVLRLVPSEGGPAHDLRFDALGSAELHVPPGLYAIGLLYQP
ncbi:MAG TPA: hypothetical protein VLI67_02830 [Vicinamibacteria bacterium]|nr:hypothetical protein [Vicinamibacteria bacterium]